MIIRLIVSRIYTNAQTIYSQQSSNGKFYIKNFYMKPINVEIVYDPAHKVINHCKIYLIT